MSAPVPPAMESMRQSPPPVQRRLFRQQRLWRRLIAYRPLIVLGGIWLGLLAIAFLAFGQLTHNAPDQPTATEPAPPYPHERLNNGSAAPAPTPATSPESTATAPTTTATESAPQTVNGLSVWTLAALVASCAGGCWLLSVVIKMPRKPKKRRPQRSQKAKAGKRYRLSSSQRPPVSASLPAQRDAQATSGTTVPKLETYDPDQPLVASSKPTKPEPVPSPAAVPEASEVTVVSEETQHQLDWPSDSLVNTADMRQRRSLSSFM
jgi:hypothetical protein